VRESISSGYLAELSIPSDVTLDAAFMDTPDIYTNEDLLNKNQALNEFISENKIVGLTITDLKWNPKYSNNRDLPLKINKTFEKFISYLISEGYKIVFIPQLFGHQNDSNYMKTFIKNDASFMVVDENYDTYFQQYLISKLDFVIGMRYHSNIFAAKMKTPFISISYEQKMSGFMKKSDLQEYCIDVLEVNSEKLIALFQQMLKNKSEFRNKLTINAPSLKEESLKTIQVLNSLLQK
jgi:colanic acid/amylovoran biosynthesis protein